MKKINPVKPVRTGKKILTITQQLNKDYNKPIVIKKPEDRIEFVNWVVSKHQYAYFIEQDLSHHCCEDCKHKHAKQKVLMDGFSASTIKVLYDALGAEAKKKFISKPLQIMAQMAITIVHKDRGTK